MNQLERLSCFLMFLILFTGQVFAGGQNRAGTSAAPVLMIPVGSQYIAMGGANVSTVKGLEAIYWNPAGVALSGNDADALFSYRQYIADMSMSFVAASGDLGIGTFGVSFRSLNVGDINVTTMDQPDGTGEILSHGEDIAILAVGSMVDYATKASSILNENGIRCELVNMRFIKPLDTKLLDEIATKFDKVVTIEENNLPGGFGSAVLEYFNDKNYKNDVLRIGIPDKFIDHGTQPELHKQIDIDPDGIVSRITSFFKSEKATVKVTY